MASSESKVDGVNGLPYPMVGDTVAVGASGTVISIAVKVDDITTPYPKAKEFFLEGLNFNAQYNQFEEAIECYDKALALDPQNAGVWVLKGSTFEGLGRNDEAAECYKNTAEIDPQYAGA